MAQLSYLALNSFLFPSEFPPTGYRTKFLFLSSFFKIISVSKRPYSVKSRLSHCQIEYSVNY